MFWTVIGFICLWQKKVRVLITVREKGVRTVCTECRMETKAYAMKGLSMPEAMNLLEKEVNKGLSPN